MIDVQVIQNQNQKPIGFQMKGHAGYAAYGQDIVCAAVSVLVINTVNSIEEFTEDTFEYHQDEKKDLVTFRITSGEVSASAQLLLDSLVLGLKAIESEYGKKHIRVKTKRKQEV